MLIGVGNRWRHDDAAGLEVASLCGGVLVEGDCVGLVDLMADSDEVTIVDACSSRAAPGTVHAFSAGAAPLPALAWRSSTHAFGVPEALELARSLGRLPPRVTVYAIEGADFTAGEGLTPAVDRAARALAGRISNG